MKRLVDPLTTIDAKLWADEFMKVKARLGEPKFDHAMMLGWFANAIMQGYDEGQRRAKADTQATVEALQARVKELEAIKTPDDAFTYCAYCGEKSPVDEHNEDLSAHIKVCPKHPMRDAESQLTQRTAELTQILAAVDEGLALTDIRLAIKTVEETRAELERVRLLSSHNERRFEMLEEKYKEFHTLIATLPKVEGEIVVNGRTIDEQYPTLSWQIASTGMDEFTNAIAALLKHRQGMEG